jgi:putative tryptophan/tyrosine transport system substrate-binding protein
MSRLALLWNPDSVGNERYFAEAQGAATSLKLSVQSIPARNSEEIDAALVALSRERAEGLVIVAEALLTIHRARIIDYATQRGIPTASYLPEFADSGSVLAYGPSPTEQLRRAANFVDRILKGAKPADLPVEQPTTFTFVVNQKSAKALKLTIPSSLLARADRVIE